VYACSLLSLAPQDQAGGKKKVPAITPAQLRLILKTVLPLRKFDIETALWMSAGFSGGIIVPICHIDIKIWPMVAMLHTDHCRVKLKKGGGTAGKNVKIFYDFNKNNKSSINPII